MNKVSLIAGTAAMLGMALPFAAFAQTAQTYEYVNTSGIVEEVNATSADQALLLAPDIASNSGVLLVSADMSVPAINTSAANPALMTTTTTTGGNSMNSGTNMTTGTDMTPSSTTSYSSTDQMDDLPPGAILPGSMVATTTTTNYTATTTSTNT